MGFFSKIKQNLNHGGVSVHLQAPQSVSMTNPSLPVIVAITATSGQQSVKSVSVEIIAESRNQSFSQPSTTNAATTANVVVQVVARAESVEPFVLQPGQTKQVELAIIMNVGAYASGQVSDNAGAAAVASLVQHMQSLQQSMNQVSYRYTIKAKADVEGITLDPTDAHAIQILKPGEVGAAFGPVSVKID